MINFFDFFSYSFILRSFEAGIIVALIAPLIGIFLVLRRYAAISDTLSHISLAGVAIGLLLKVNPLITAVGTALVSSFAVEELRLSKKIYGESALALFFSGSLALAIILISLAHGFSVDIFNYLFGSLATVQSSDVVMIGALGLFVGATIIIFFKELVYITFDEEAAAVAGIPVRPLNFLFIGLAAITVALAIPTVGVLLISALVVIPVITALSFRQSFIRTLVIAEAVSVVSVIAGIVASFYLNLPTGGTIVLFLLALFGAAFFINR